MNSLELLSVLKGKLGSRTTFLGIFSAEQLAEIGVLDTPTTFIVNILESHEDRMGHWVAFYLHKTQAIFFDSFGLPPHMYSPHFSSFLQHYKPIYTFHKQLQSHTSLVCGLYACLFIYLTSLFPISYVSCYLAGEFSTTNFQGNDTLVKIFSSKYLNYRKH